MPSHAHSCSMNLQQVASWLHGVGRQSAWRHHEKHGRDFAVKYSSPVVNQVCKREAQPSTQDEGQRATHIGLRLAQISGRTRLLPHILERT